MISTLIAIVVIIIVLFLLFKVFQVVVRLVLIVAFLLAAYLTNPDLSAHQRAVEAKASATNQRFREKKVTVNDFKIFSLTYLEEDGGNKLIGAGMFTWVWIFGEV
jgi:hypothetical protein